ncbi:MAG: DNA cytosine methyltransferase, partial [Nitrosomonas ureae]
MPKIIDLFAGAGGLSLGAARAGFEVSAAVELDTFALETHINNFPKTTHISEDVSELTAERLLLLAGLHPGELDGIIGGPPCQGFSHMGKRQVDDTRNNLFGHFFRLVSETRPGFFLAENVPGILDEKYRAVLNSAFSQLADDYVVLPPIKVQANLYGAPTTRTRIFFFGYDPKKINSTFAPEDFAPLDDVELTVVKRALTG